MDWEQAKENCVPVRQGRRKAALQELADPTADALEKKRRDLWDEVVQYQGDDPLEPWLRYIKWMQEYGVGGGKTDLLKVLEACTKELQKHTRYTDDIRFLRIWIQYADCLPDPGDVFLFLKEKGIGHGFALYYEAYATHFELRGNFQSAEAVYADGLQRGAKPVDRLKQKHQAFQQRMAHRIQRRIQDEQVTGPPQPEPARSSLSTIGQRPGGRRPQGQQPQSIFGTEGPRSSSLPFGARSGQPDQQQGLRPGLELRADDEFDPENGFMGLPGYSSMPQANNLRELKPFSVIRKENLDRPVAWNQAALQPGGSQLTGVAGGGLDIFTDEEFQDGSNEEPGLPTGRATTATTPGPASAASCHPLLLATSAHGPAGGLDALMSSLAPPPALLRGIQPGLSQPVSFAPMAAMTSTRGGGFGSAHNAQRDVLPLASDAAGPREQRGAVALSSSQRAEPGPPQAATVPGVQQAVSTVAQQPAVGETVGEDESGPGPDAEGEELSFEENRAAAWFRRNPMPLPPGCGASGAGSRACGVSIGTGSSGLETVGCGAANCLSFGDENASQPRGPGPSSRSNVTGSDAPQTRNAAESENSVPASTHRSALGACPGGTVLRRPLGDAATIASRGATLAVPTAAAAPRHDPPVLDSRAAAGSSSHRDPARDCGSSSTSRHDDLQPTVTISTRSAFDLMNSLFSEDLPHQQQRRNQAGKMGGGGVEVPRARPALSQLAMPDSQPVMSEPAPRAPQPPVPPPPTSMSAAAAPAGLEPTVTLHTRLAFDALNDMFNDTLPHEEARKLARRVGAEGSNTTTFKPITSSDVCRLANAGRAAGMPPPAGHSGRSAPFGSSYTGPQSTGAMNPVGAPASSLAMHEDTFFLGCAGAASAAAARGSTGGSVPVTGPPPGAHQSASAPDSIYEDTVFISRGPPRYGQGFAGAAGAPPGGAPILEDTEFITRPQPTGISASAPFTEISGRDSKPQVETAVFGAAATHGRAQHSNGLKPGALGRPHGALRDVRASSAFVQLEGVAPQVRGATSRGALQIYEDTDL